MVVIKLKVLQINSFGNLSTGSIAVNIHKVLIKNNGEGCIAFARNTIEDGIPYIKIGNKLSIIIDGISTRITDKAGYYSRRNTKKLIREIENYNPDIIHLHNLHGYYINIEILFNYLKSINKPVVWTLHDCWAYTGHCCYYSMNECYKWKNGCFKCKQKAMYPSSIVIDNSRQNYNKKKKLFLGMPNLVIVSVSKWLESDLKKSFLGSYESKVIYNGVDFNKFKPTKSNLREKYNLNGKFIILGVASTWDVRKGLDDFVKLSKMLNDNFRIILIGVDEKQASNLPNNIIAVKRTTNIEELAAFYTLADIFFNASIEETFGLPTIEAMACGTTVIVYNVTALPEVVNNTCGYIVEKKNINKVYSIVNKLQLGIEKKHIDKEYIKKFDIENVNLEYIKLYRSLMR